MSDIPFPEMPGTRQQAIPDHEVVLSFRDDDHAVMFRDWLEEHGWDSFTAWAREQG